MDIDGVKTDADGRVLIDLEDLFVQKLSAVSVSFSCSELVAVLGICLN